MSMISSNSSHPYLPSDLHLPDYVPQSLSPLEILGPYSAASIVVSLLVWNISGYFCKLSKADKFFMCWWTFSGLTHIILESYYFFTPEFYKNTTSYYFAEVWKEASKGDSRIAARSSNVLSLEVITIFIGGPACLLAVFAIAAKKPYSYILQFAISVGYLYGDMVYAITAILDGDNFSASPYHYWSYFVGSNMPWVIVPAISAFRCWRKITASMSHPKPKTN